MAGFRRLQSIIAFHLAPTSSKGAFEIPSELFSEIDGFDGAKQLRQLQYVGVIKGIKAQLAQIEYDIRRFNSPEAVGGHEEAMRVAEHGAISLYLESRRQLCSHIKIEE